MKRCTSLLVFILLMLKLFGQSDDYSILNDHIANSKAPDSNIVFNSSDPLLIKIKAGLKKIKIKSDTWNENAQNEINIYAASETDDIINVGRFLNTGLYKTSVSQFVTDDSTDSLKTDTLYAKWQIPGYIDFREIGGIDYGLWWKVGSEDSVINMSNFYVYSYSSLQANSSDTSILISGSDSSENKPDSALDSIRTVFDNLELAIKNVDKKLFNDRLANLINSLSAKIDTSDTYKLTLYLTRQLPLVLFVTDSTVYNLKDSCKQDSLKHYMTSILDSVFDILADTSISLLCNDSINDSCQKIAAMSSDLDTFSKSTVNGIFSNRNLFYRFDKDNADYTLRSLESSYQVGNSALWVGNQIKNNSEQIVISAIIIRNTQNNSSKTFASQ